MVNDRVICLINYRSDIENYMENKINEILVPIGEIIDIIEMYKPTGNIYNGYNSIEEKVDEQITYTLDDVISSIKNHCQDIAVQGSERLIPKPVKIEYDTTNGCITCFEVAKCPNCDVPLDDVSEFCDVSYCLHCGQALDWSDEKCNG